MGLPNFAWTFRLHLESGLGFLSTLGLLTSNLWFLLFCQKLSWVSFGILECDTRFWVFSHPTCITNHIYFSTNLLQGFHFPILFLVNGHSFQWEGLLPSSTPMNKEWLLGKIRLMFYTTKMHKVIVRASLCSSLCFSSKFALYFC